MFSISFPTAGAYDTFRAILEEVAPDSDTELVEAFRKAELYIGTYYTHTGPLTSRNLEGVPLTRELLDAFVVESSEAEKLRAKMSSALEFPELEGKLYAVMQDVVSKGKRGKGDVVRRVIHSFFVHVTPKEYLGLMAILGADFDNFSRLPDGSAKIPLYYDVKVVPALMKLIQEGVCQ